MSLKSREEVARLFDEKFGEFFSKYDNEDYFAQAQIKLFIDSIRLQDERDKAREVLEDVRLWLVENEGNYQGKMAYALSSDLVTRLRERVELLYNNK